MAAMTAISTLFQVGSAYMQGRDQSTQLDYQQAQIESSSTSDRVALANRQDARRVQLRKTLSSLRAGAGAAGIGADDGSMAAVQAGYAADAARDGSYDIDSYEASEANARNAARMTKYQKSNIPIATGVSAASSVASNLLRWNSLGG